MCGTGIQWQDRFIRGQYGEIQRMMSVVFYLFIYIIGDQHTPKLRNRSMEAVRLKGGAEW